MPCGPAGSPPRPAPLFADSARGGCVYARRGGAGEMSPLCHPRPAASVSPASRPNRQTLNCIVYRMGSTADRGTARRGRGKTWVRHSRVAARRDLQHASYWGRHLLLMVPYRASAPRHKAAAKRRRQCADWDAEPPTRIGADGLEPRWSRTGARFPAGGGAWRPAWWRCCTLPAGRDGHRQKPESARRGLRCDLDEHTRHTPPSCSLQPAPAPAVWNTCK